MTYGIDDLVEALNKLEKYGVKYVIIGDTVVQLALKSKGLSSDVDLFVEEPSPLIEEELYRNVAENENWGYSTTEIGTPRLIARIEDKEIIIEIYENFMDIEIPDQVIAEAKSLKLRGLKVRVLHPEQYFVLKARQGVDLDKLVKYIKMLKKIDKKLLLKTIEYFPDEEQGLIIERLKSIGLEI